jgi:ribosome-binding protein aMBF1 (putative translation factor)
MKDMTCQCTVCGRSAHPYAIQIKEPGVNECFECATDGLGSNDEMAETTKRFFSKIDKFWDWLGA